MKDYEKAFTRMQAVLDQINLAASENRYISMTKACELAGVNESYIYKVLDNSDEYKIPEIMLDKFQDARDRLIDVMIQRVRRVGKWSEEDSPSKIARANLEMKTEAWLLKNLLPKKFGDKVSVDSNNINNTTNNLVLAKVELLDSEVLKQIASAKLIESNKS